MCSRAAPFSHVHGLHPWLLKVNPVGVRCYELYFFSFWGCGLKNIVQLLFGLSAIPPLRFGAASIPQPFNSKSLFNFYYVEDDAIDYAKEYENNSVFNEILYILSSSGGQVW
jgi:hypothetical protein